MRLDTAKANDWKTSWTRPRRSCRSFGQTPPRCSAPSGSGSTTLLMGEVRLWTFCGPASSRRGSRAGGTGNTELAAALCPPMLVAKCTPVEFRSWKGCFKTYLNSRCMAGTSEEEKRGFLRNHLDSSLEMAMKTQLMSNMSMEGTDSCMEQFGKLVMQCNPVSVRRAAF